MYHPATGDVVVIEAVESGSHDVLGLTGTVVSTRVAADLVQDLTLVRPSVLSVIVPATQVRPA